MTDSTASVLRCFDEFWSRTEGRSLARCEVALAGFPIHSLLESAVAAKRPRLLRALSASAFVHPNGFTKITLPGSGRDGRFLRIHVWSAGSSESIEDSDAHDHRWDFSSRILVGRLSNLIYTSEKDPDGDHVEYAHTELEHSVGFAEVGRSSLQLDAREESMEHTTYSLDHRLIHRVGASTPGSLVATMVLEQVPRRAGTRIFRSGARAVSESGVRTSKCSVPHTKATLASLLR